MHRVKAFHLALSPPQTRVSCISGCCHVRLRRAAEACSPSPPTTLVVLSRLVTSHRVWYLPLCRPFSRALAGQTCTQGSRKRGSQGCCSRLHRMNECCYQTSHASKMPGAHHDGALQAPRGVSVVTLSLYRC